MHINFVDVTVNDTNLTAVFGLTANDPTRRPDPTSQARNLSFRLKHSEKEVWAAGLACLVRPVSWKRLLVAENVLFESPGVKCFDILGFCQGAELLLPVRLAA